MKKVFLIMAMAIFATACVPNAPLVAPEAPVVEPEVVQTGTLDTTTQTYLSAYVVPEPTNVLTVKADWIPDGRYRTNIWIGDTICQRVINTTARIDTTAMQQVGMGRYCNDGRKVGNTLFNPNNQLGFVYIALGTYDVLDGTPLEEFRASYQRLVDSILSPKITCVLPAPNLMGKDSTAYRDVIKSICTYILDMQLETEVTFSNNTQVFLTDEEQYFLWIYLVSYFPR